MTTSIATPPKLQFFDANGVPLSGGKLYTYAAGTTTPLATYTSSSGSTANTNPVILDSRGEANVWLGTATYKMKLASSTDVEIWTVDNLYGPDQATLSVLAASSGSSLVGYTLGASGAVATTVQTKLRETVSIKDFGAVGDGVTDDSLAFHSLVVWLNARAGGATVLFPQGTYLMKWDYDLWGSNNGYMSSCDGIRFIGQGATIKIKDGARCGTFGGVYKDEGYGFVFDNCTNTVVENFYLNGNISNISYGASDGNCYGVAFYGNCTNSIVRNVTAYAFATDGFLCRANGGKNILYENAKADSNRRQGISITAGEQITLISSQFINTGSILGTAPQSGCDIEPISPRFVKDVTFLNCLFQGNGLTQTLLDSGTDYIDNVNFINCRFDTKNSAGTLKGTRALWCKEQTAKFTNCYFNGSIIYGYGSYTNCDMYHDDTTGSGSYAFENSESGTGSSSKIFGGTITVIGGIKAFYLDTATAAIDRKIIDGTNCYVNGTSLTSGTFWALARQYSQIKNVYAYLSGTLPASPFYVNQTSAEIWDCTSSSSSLVFGSSSTGAQNSAGVQGITYVSSIDGATIATGAITANGNVMSVNTEGSAATDDLDTINGGVAGYMLWIYAVNAARTVVVKHNTGNILLDGSTDKTLDNSVDMLGLYYNGSKWVQISFSNNGA